MNIKYNTPKFRRNETLLTVGERSVTYGDRERSVTYGDQERSVTCGENNQHRHCGLDPQSPCFFAGGSGVSHFREDRNDGVVGNGIIDKIPLLWSGRGGFNSGLPRSSFLTARNDGTTLICYPANLENRNKILVQTKKKINRIIIII